MEKLSIAINFYFSSVVVPLGILLNIFALVIFSRESLSNKHHMRVMYLSLAIFDTMALTNSIFFIQLLPSLDINLDEYSDFSCKLVTTWRRTVIQTPSWIQVIITFDRFRLIFLNKKFNFMEKIRNIRLMMFGVFFLLLLINSGHLAYYLSINNQNDMLSETNQTSVSCTATPILLNITDVMNVILRSYLPFLIMLACNILLTRELIRSKKKMLKSDSFRREYNFTFTVIGMNIFFFILYTPWSVYYILNRIYNSSTPNLSQVIIERINLLRSISFSFAYLNNASVFVVNAIFNKLFRKELFGLFKRSKLNSETALSTQ
jgi:hypothetical protein